METRHASELIDPAKLREHLQRVQHEHNRSVRDIAKRAGLSHTAIQKLAKPTAPNASRYRGTRHLKPLARALAIEASALRPLETDVRQDNAREVLAAFGVDPAKLPPELLSPYLREVGAELLEIAPYLPKNWRGERGLVLLANVFDLQRWRYCLGNSLAGDCTPEDALNNGRRFVKLIGELFRLVNSRKNRLRAEAFAGLEQALRIDPSDSLARAVLLAQRPG